MAFVEPVTLESRNVRLLPLGLVHEEGIRAAASDGQLWKLRVTSVPEPHEAKAYIETALQSKDDKVTVPPLVGALLKNEQDVTLFEKLVFMQRNNR